MQGQHVLPVTADLVPGAPSIIRLGLDRSMATGGDPFRGGEQLTPNDAADTTIVHRALWIGTAGTLAAVVMDKDGTTRNTIATTVAQGVFPFQVLRVLATGTTAAGIVAGH